MIKRVLKFIFRPVWALTVRMVMGLLTWAMAAFIVLITIAAYYTP